MNWLDVVLLSIIVVSCIVGMKIGLIKVAFAVAGVVVGWFLAGQISDDIGALFDSSATSYTVVTVISYTLIILVSAAIASYSAKLFKPVLTVLTLGMSSMADRLIGLVLGLMLGIALTGALVVVSTRLTYDFDRDVLDRNISTQFAASIPQVTYGREKLEDALADSTVVTLFVETIDSLPAEGLGFATSDFKVALDMLQTAMKQ